MSSKVREVIPDPEAEGALAALRRARLDAELVALRTGTDLIQAKDGKPVRVPPRPEVAKTAKVPGRASKSS
jgi:hypothetical protein